MSHKNKQLWVAFAFSSEMLTSCGSGENGYHILGHSVPQHMRINHFCTVFSSLSRHLTVPGKTTMLRISRAIAPECRSPWSSIPRLWLRHRQVVSAAITGQQYTFNPKQNTCKRAACWTGWDTRRDSGRSQDSKRHSRSDENKTRKRAPSEKRCFNNEPSLETTKERGWKIRPHENSRWVYS